MTTRKRQQVTKGFVQLGLDERTIIGSVFPRLVEPLRPVDFYDKSTRVKNYPAVARLLPSYTNQKALWA